MRKPLSAVLPLLLPGTAFWVLVFVGIATGNAGVWIAAAIVGVVAFLGLLLLVGTKAVATRSTKKRVWADGVPATAKVLKARADGSLNNHPYVDLTLEVTVPHQSPRTVELRQVVSQLLVGRIEPGKEIPVKVDRDNPDVVVIDEELTPYGY
jgi:uncharacterized membrane protein